MWDEVGPINGNHLAKHGEHVIVNFNVAPAGNIEVTLPPSVLKTKGLRVRITDVSADGGRGNGAALVVLGQFSPIAGGHYADSGYIVASVDVSGTKCSRRGANIELLDMGDGWLVVEESCQPY